MDRKESVTEAQRRMGDASDRPSMALRRMDFLARAIRDRDWDGVEFHYDAVLSAMKKELGVPRGRPGEGSAQPEEDGEEFTWMHWTWDVTGAKEVLADQEPGVIEVGKLGFLLRLINVDLDHAKTVDLSEPIILGWLPNAEGTIPIDGWHRIARAVAEGVPTLRVKQLSREQSAALIVQDRS